jgi:putative SOS response-associated peptidase YedK
MCGRYTLFRLDQLLKNFPNLRLPPDMLPHYNIAPTQLVPAISNTHPDRLDFFRWGLVPSWAKDISIGNRLINARAETLADKPAFRTALRRRRCLVPADGFYEWRKEGGKIKTPLFIHLRSGEPFALAGLWDTWHSADGSEMPSLTIITTAPNELMKTIHDRMPAIVRREDYARWLAPEEADPEELAGVLKPYPAEEMEAYPVSPRVNKPAHDAPDCIERAEPQTLFG